MISKLILCFEHKNVIDAVTLAQLFKKLICSQDTNIDVLPITDGGGFLPVYRFFFPQAETEKFRVHDSMGNLIEIEVLQHEDKLYCQSSDILGKPLISDFGFKSRVDRDSRGLGELILQVKERGFSELIIACGGSLVTDAGLGLYNALANENFSLHDAQKLKFKNFSKDFGLNVTVLYDTDVFFYGKNGQCKVFGEQKGFSINERVEFDKKYLKVASDLNKSTNISPQVLGGGASGGTAGMLHSVFDATLVSGISFCMNVLGLKQKIHSAKKVIISEGKYDSTSNKKGFGHLKKIIENEGKLFGALVGVTTQSVDFKMFSLFNYPKNNITKEILTNRVLSSRDHIINFLLDIK